MHLDVQAIGYLVVLCGETEMGVGEGCEVPETKDTGEVTERDKRGEREVGGEGRAGERDGVGRRNTHTWALVPGEGC